MTAFWRHVCSLDKYEGRIEQTLFLDARTILLLIVSRPFDRDSDCLKLNSISSWHAWRKKKKKLFPT